MEATATARQLEAAGATTVTFEFRGADVTIPLAIEDWPLDAVRANKPATAVRILLGQQRPPMSTRGDVIELSHRMADACGITPLPELDADPDAAMGAVPTLIDLVDNHGDDLEADLLRYFGADYRQSAAAGGPTLRQVWVYVRRLPRESALLAARNRGEPPWSQEAIVTARLWEMWTQKRYGGRPLSRGEYDEWVAKQAEIAGTNDHLAERENYYSSGQNMRDYGQDPGPRAPTQPPQDSPTSRALAVAIKNARRTPRKDTSNGRGPAAHRGQRYSPGGSGWG